MLIRRPAESRKMSTLGCTGNAQTRRVGVMPRDFRFLDVTDADAILSLRFAPNQMTIGNSSAHGIARLSPA
jgi:hypothetical protein